MYASAMFAMLDKVIHCFQSIYRSIPMFKLQSCNYSLVKRRSHRIIITFQSQLVLSNRGVRISSLSVTVL